VKVRLEEALALLVLAPLLGCGARSDLALFGLSRPSIVI
jgi:hypothetical protein